MPVLSSTGIVTGTYCYADTETPQRFFHLLKNYDAPSEHFDNIYRD